MPVSNQYQDYYKHVNANPPPFNPELSQTGNGKNVLYPDLHKFPQPVPTAPPAIDEEVNELDDCSICLENCKEHPEGNASLAINVAKTACKHVFHDLCLQKWMTNKNTCPNCRSIIQSNAITHLKFDANGNFVPPAPAEKPKEKEEQTDISYSPANLVFDFLGFTGKVAAFTLGLFGQGVLEAAKLSGKAAYSLGSGAVSLLTVSEETQRQRIQVQLMTMRIENEKLLMTLERQFNEQKNFAHRIFRDKTAILSRLELKEQYAEIENITKINNQLVQQANLLQANFTKLKEIAEKRR